MTLCFLSIHCLPKPKSSLSQARRIFHKRLRIHAGPAEVFRLRAGNSVFLISANGAFALTHVGDLAEQYFLADSAEHRFIADNE